MTDLDKLIKAIEGGDNFGIIPMTQAALTPHEYSNPHGDRVVRAFDGSLDAAKALHEALLPGWGWDVGMGNFNPIEAFVHFGSAGFDYKCKGATSINPARAWLIAILKAYRSMQ